MKPHVGQLLTVTLSGCVIRLRVVQVADTGFARGYMGRAR